MFLHFETLLCNFTKLIEATPKNNFKIVQKYTKIKRKKREIMTKKVGREIAEGSVVSDSNNSNKVPSIFSGTVTLV